MLSRALCHNAAAMTMSRKQFLALSGKAAGAAALTTWSLLGPDAALAADVLDSAEVRKVHEAIARSKSAHIRKVQEDLRQPSVSSWNRGIDEMAARMMAHFKAIGCREINLVKTDGLPGIFAYYDGGAPKTLSVYMMYDTQPFEESRWTSPPLEARLVPMPPFQQVVIARGAVNDKGPNRMFLNALESILEAHGRLPVNIMFTCDGEEEQGSPHFHQVLEPYRDRLKTCDAHLTIGPHQDKAGGVTLALGGKGILYLEIEASGARWGRGPQKRPIHSSRKAILDSPTWRLVEALRTLYEPATDRILVPGYYDAIRPPSDEEAELMRVLTTRFKGRLFGSERENTKVWTKDWNEEEAARHLTFDTTLNIDGLWAGYTGPGSATILPEKATVKLDSRLVPNQEIAAQKRLIQEHLEKGGFGDLEVRQIGGGDEWSQTSVRESVVQAVLSVYRKYGIEPQIWPRHAGSTPEHQYTRGLGLPAASAGLGHGGRAHSDDEYLVIEGNNLVAGIVRAEQAIADILYGYAAWPEPRRPAQAPK
jgi:acetylornithine deacetylase/succinyl-diaminopimelate desuccinylase-like protein